jgi:16S rRNA (cytosine1402-N4)-methyltransferase
MAWRVDISEPGHAPVMAREVVEAMAPADGEIYVDGTFGAGGYARALLDAADCTVWGIDRDPVAVAVGAALADHYGGRLKVLQGSFGAMAELLAERAVKAVDGVTLDLGVSSLQLDDPARGFSFRFDGPLDMRMGEEGQTAADVVNGADEASLADIIASYGEERRARAVARAIVAARRQQPIERTGRLANIVAEVVHRTPGGVHPATRTFQALRIYVNDELGQLAAGLAAAEQLLAPKGRLTVVSFHSLEDRIVKRFLKARAGVRARPSRHQPEVPGERLAASFDLIFRRARKPRADEIEANPRARSARLRAAIRTSAPAWPAEAAA